MAKLTVKQIQEELRAILDASREGIRWTQMMRRVREQHPETPENTIHGATHALLSKEADIVKIARGTYLLKKYLDVATQNKETLAPDVESIEVQTPKGAKLKIYESDFYEPFAEWLRDEIEEVNEVVSVGGNILKGKWGTPDVIGVLKPRAYDHVKFEPQFVSAEIKMDPQQPIVAFGQAMAYRLFSHKSYMVMPDTISEDDLSRLDALAMIYGLGFVTFAIDKAAPDFKLRVRAIASQPDMFYVNQMAKRILEHSSEMFQKLF
jgi:hypothetical protein